MIAALYVEKNGPYSLKGIDLWDELRDARKYRGPHPVIAHPPCERWGRYWGGGPMLHGTKNQKLLGDDNGCFAHALWSVRTFGGVIEHPEGSHAFRYYGLDIPNRNGGWTAFDSYGCRVSCVAQGHYGHRAQKFTWLYAKVKKYPELIWGKCVGKIRLEEGFHSREERNELIAKRGASERITAQDRLWTPLPFRDLLIGMIGT